MKNLFFSAVFLLIAATSYSQTGQGAIVFSAYVGFPNIDKVLVQFIVESAATEQSIEQSNLRISGFGPTGARGEYFVSERLSLGLDIAYTRVAVNFDGVKTDQNGNQVVYNYGLSSTKLGFLPYLNFHFVQTGAVDFFMHVGAGYKTRSLKSFSNDPSFIPASETGAVLPVAFRAGLGVRYFFTPFMGAHVNFGLGHSGLINTGLTFSL